MKLVFVRHGETTAKPKQLMGQRLDPSLSDVGIKQVNSLLPKLNRGFEIIFSSPLRRASETAEIISKHLGISVIFKDELKERDFGSLSGKAWNTISKEIIEADKQEKYDYSQYGGESIETVKKRVGKFLDELKTKYNNSKVLIITHGGIIRLLYKVFYNTEYLPGALKEASLHEFDI